MDHMAAVTVTVTVNNKCVGNIYIHIVTFILYFMVTKVAGNNNFWTVVKHKYCVLLSQIKHLKM